MSEQGIFPEQQQPQRKQTPQDAAYISLTKNVTALGGRLRVLEDQYSNLRNKSQLTDRNLIEFEKTLSQDLKSLSEDILELKRSLQQLKETIDIVGSELGNAVKEHDFRVLEKYVDLWNPGQFVTREKLKEEVKEILKNS